MHTASAADILMTAQVVLPQGEDLRLEEVLRRSQDSNGKATGNSNNISILNTMLYDVQFPDGTIKPYSAHIIAGNTLNQVDKDGYQCQLLEGILDHSKNGRTADKKNQ